MPDLVERVCVADGCDVVLVDRAPSARYCSRACRRRAEWLRIVARERARQAAELVQASEVAAASADPERLTGEPFWCWRVRSSLAQHRTDEAAALWQRAVELVVDDEIPVELARAAAELGWQLPARWSS